MAAKMLPFQTPFQKMQPRQSNAAKMLPFETPFQKMQSRQSNAANIVHFTYQAPNVFYNNPLFSFNYTTYRGNSSVLVRQGVVMESNNGSL